MGSGLGKTCGRGHKGQKARAGGYHKVGFEGGQMPLFRRLPKRGFTNAPFKNIVEIVNIQRLNDVFEDGACVDRLALVEKGILKSKASYCKSSKRLLKVLGTGNLSKKLTIIADAFSISAIAAIEKLGGKAQLTKEG